jgi:hypothetical protein
MRQYDDTLVPKCDNAPAVSSYTIGQLRSSITSSLFKTIYHLFRIFTASRHTRYCCHNARRGSDRHAVLDF